MSFVRFHFTASATAALSVAALPSLATMAFAQDPTTATPTSLSPTAVNVSESLRRTLSNTQRYPAINLTLNKSANEVMTQLLNATGCRYEFDPSLVYQMDGKPRLLLTSHVNMKLVETTVPNALDSITGALGLSWTARQTRDGVTLRIVPGPVTPVGALRARLQATTDAALRSANSPDMAYTQALPPGVVYDPANPYIVGLPGATTLYASPYADPNQIDPRTGTFYAPFVTQNGALFPSFPGQNGGSFRQFPPYAALTTRAGAANLLGSYVGAYGARRPLAEYKVSIDRRDTTFRALIEELMKDVLSKGAELHFDSNVPADTKRSFTIDKVNLATALDALCEGLDLSWSWTPATAPARPMLRISVAPTPARSATTAAPARR